MARGGKLERPGSILLQLMDNLKLSKDYKAHQLFYYWDRAVGATIAAHVRPVRLDFHTLFLKADSPVWANQLMLMKEELLQKINGFVAGLLVKEIRFGRDPFWQKKREPVQQYEAEPEEKPLPASNEEEKEKALQLCCDMQDEGLREAARRALQRVLAKRRWRREAGWHACPSCGVLCEEQESSCFACRLQRNEVLKRKVRRYLEVKPWASYGEIYEQFECSRELMGEARTSLLQTWLGRLTYSKEDRESEGAKKLVMLYTARRPEDVSDELREKILKKLRFDMRPMPKNEEKL